MNEQFQRTALLIGEKNVEKLNKSAIAVFGIGGVGSFVSEALSRGGIGKLILIDNDKINTTNLNRQLVALNSTIGKFKVDIMKERILDINKNAEVITYQCFFDEKSINNIDFSAFDYIVDAIDTVTSKLLLIKTAKEKNIPIISCMGAGNKFDPTKFEVSDIFKTSVCPLARVMRLELKKRGITNLKVVYSKEQPVAPLNSNSIEENGNSARRQTPGSLSFVPSVAGLIIAGEVIKDLIK